MADSFIYSQPVKIYFGPDKFLGLGSILDELKIERCIVACGRHSVADAEKLMDVEKRVCGVFSEVEENPQLSSAVKIAELAKEKNAEAIIGLGGGSKIDAAKFAAAIALGDGKAEEYYRGERPFPENRLKIIAVPTTAGTGSEVTQVSVINCGDEKKTINNPVFMPTVAIIDPVLGCSTPPRTTMNTGLDAMAHALEGYWSVNHQPISDIMAIEAVRLILANLETAYKDGNDIEARSNMAKASLMGGLAFALPKTAGCHACSYPLSIEYHMSHGEACAFTLDSFVMINADERLNYLCRAVGLSGPEELAQRISELKKLAGLRTRLSELGNVDMDKLAKDSADHPLMRNNPVKMDEENLRKMFEDLK